MQRRVRVIGRFPGESDHSRVRARRCVDQSVHEVYPHALQVHVHPQWQAELRELRVIVPRYGRLFPVSNFRNLSKQFLMDN